MLDGERFDERSAGLGAKLRAFVGVFGRHVAGEQGPGQVGRAGDVAVLVHTCLDLVGRADRDGVRMLRQPPVEVAHGGCEPGLVAATLERHQRVDGLVNNVGTSLHAPLAEVDLDEYRKVLDTNVVSLLAMTQAVLSAMRERSFGRIVNISSGTTRMVLAGDGAYSATKSAVNMLSAVFRAELADDGIAVSLLLPSMTATEFGDNMFQLGVEPRPGAVVHRPEYVAEVSCECCAPARTRSTFHTARSSQI